MRRGAMRNVAGRLDPINKQVGALQYLMGVGLFNSVGQRGCQTGRLESYSLKILSISLPKLWADVLNYIH